MSLIQRIKQRFCRHEDDPCNRNKVMPFAGYIFQCPKCKAHVAYFDSWGEYADITEKECIIFTEEGAKLWEIMWNRKDDENG